MNKITRVLRIILGRPSADKPADEQFKPKPKKRKPEKRVYPVRGERYKGESRIQQINAIIRRYSDRIRRGWWR